MLGWFDPLSELIQNALDSVEKRMEMEKQPYDPKLNIIIEY